MVILVKRSKPRTAIMYHRPKLVQNNPVGQSSQAFEKDRFLHAFTNVIQLADERCLELVKLISGHHQRWC